MDPNNEPVLNAKVEPHFLVVLLKACYEAQDHQNEADQALADDDMDIPVPVLDFLASIVANHPEPEVAKFYLDEIKRLVGEGSETA